MFKLILLSGFFMSVLTSGYCQLNNVSATINDIQALSGNTFVAVGDGGCIRKTDDGGISWRLIRPVVYFDLYAITAGSENILYVSGTDGVIKSSDGGETWEFIGDPAFDKDIDIFFLDENTGYVMSIQAYISKTSDGGKTWNNCTRPDFMANMLVSYFCQLYFTDKKTGYAALYDNYGNHTTYKTTDGGDSWSEYLRGFRYIIFPAKDIGYAIKDVDKICKTTDGGKSWKEYSFGIADELNIIYFSDDRRGFATTLSGSLFYTIDGGITWCFSFTTGATINAVAASAFTENAIATGEVGLILISENKGLTWDYRSLSPVPNEILTGITFVTDNLGYTVAKSLMYKTLDGGTTWFPYSLADKTYKKDFCFLNEQTGYMVSQKAVYKTGNGGLTWDSLNFFNEYFTGVYFINEDVGFLFGDYGLFYKTNDRGKNWKELEVPIFLGSDRISEIQFVNDSTGYLVSERETACKSTDGGNTWTMCGYGSEGIALCFLDHNTGFTGRIALQKTTDGGNTWIPVEFQTIEESMAPETIIDIYFSDEQNGYILTDFKSIYHTTSGGAYWDTLEYCNIGATLLTEIGAKGNTLSVVGEMGIILKLFSNEDPIPDFKKADGNPIRNFKIYPNPASGQIFFESAIPMQEILVKFFAIDGRELISNKMKYSGNNIPLEISLPINYSGTGILQITSNETISTEKIVVF